MHGHTARIHTLTFSQESTVLVSGGADGTIRMWDVEARRPTGSGSDSGVMKNLGLAVEGMNGLRSSVGPDGGKGSATLGVLPKSALGSAGESSKQQRYELESITLVYAMLISCLS